MMKTPFDLDSKIAVKRKLTWKQWLAIILSTLIIVICCVIVIVKTYENRDIESHWQEIARQTKHEAMLKMHQADEARRARELRIMTEVQTRRHDSICAKPKVEEPEPYKPKYSWDDLEDMVRDLTNENYYASVWWEEYNSPKWVVIYTKGGKRYFRRFNPEKKTYGPKVLLIEENFWEFHASGNKRDRYFCDRRGNLIHEVKGKEKELFFNHHIIDLFTPEPVPDGYDNVEDCYYDNEEDLIEYYR